MKGIRITSLTTQGDTALSEHIKQSRHLGIASKTMMRALGISQEITTTNPLTLEIHIKKKQLQSQLNPEHLKNEIRPSLQEKGATDKKDYIMEILQ